MARRAIVVGLIGAVCWHGSGAGIVRAADDPAKPPEASAASSAPSNVPPHASSTKALDSLSNIDKSASDSKNAPALPDQAAKDAKDTKGTAQSLPPGDAKGNTAPSTQAGETVPDPQPAQRPLASPAETPKAPGAPAETAAQKTPDNPPDNPQGTSEAAAKAPEQNGAGQNPADTKPGDTTAQSAPGASAPEIAGTASAPSAASGPIAPPAQLAAASTVAGPGELRIRTAGGAYLQAQDRALFSVYAQSGANKIRTDSAPAGGSRTTLQTELAATAPAFDIADVDAAAAESACQAGTLEPIDGDRLAKASDGGAAKDDFLPGALTRCGVASTAWSSLIVFDRQKFAKNPPVTLADVFDLKRFPGQRALMRGPRYTLELALLADGVKPGDVYTELKRTEGVDRAFAKLATIQSEIEWVEKPADAMALLSQQKAVMAAAFSGRAFHEIAVNARPYGVIAQGQIYDFNVWVVPRSAPNKQAALDFIDFATRPEQLSAQARLFPYSPSRKSAIAGVDRHALLKTSLTPYLATAPANIETALRLDGAFWASQETALRERFEAWAKSRAQ